MLTVLVTGAAGLIGGEVCARLAARGHRVLGLVRRNASICGNTGEPVRAAEVIRGDVTLPLLGISRRACDLVIHCAASLEFDAPRALLAEVNIAGTRHAADFARLAGAGLLHVSTAYVCGTREGPISEAPVPPATRFTNNYEESKALAEQAAAQGGVPFAIARPSIVLGDSQSGMIREFPSLCNVFRLMARGKVPVFPARTGATLDLVPIDHVAHGIVLLAERFARAQGGYYHLVAAEPLPAAELAHGVSRLPHLPDIRVVEPGSLDPADLPAAQRLLLGRMLDTFGPYFTRDPRFATDHFRALTGLACPPTNRAWLDRLIAYGIAAGYLPSARRGRTVPAAPAPRKPTSARP